MKFLKIVAVVAICAAIIYGAHILFGNVTQQAQQMGGGTVAVEVNPVSLRDISSRIEALGTARANESIVITSTVSDRIREILFNSGDIVKAGQVLVRIADTEEKAKVMEAKVKLEEEQLRLSRIEKLRATKVVSAQAFDTQRSAVESAHASLQAAQAVLNDHTIKAPFAGMLGIRQVSLGEFLSAGKEITTLDDLSTIKLEFTVPETFLSVIRKGQDIEAKSAAWPGETFHATVTAIGARIDETTRALTVRATLPNPDLKIRAGMLMTVDLISNPRRSIGIPERALLSYSDKQYVFILNANGTASRKEVTLGQRDSGWVEVLEGLQPQQSLIVEGAMNLQDGAKVNISNKKAKTKATVPTGKENK